jgi:hypothetical protein
MAPNITGPRRFTARAARPSPRAIRPNTSIAWSRPRWLRPATTTPSRCNRLSSPPRTAVRSRTAKAAPADAGSRKHGRTYARLNPIYLGDDDRKITTDVRRCRIALRLGLAGLLIAILCLCMFVFSDIASGSPLVVLSVSVFARIEIQHHQSGGRKPRYGARTT